MIEINSPIVLKIQVTQLKKIIKTTYFPFHQEHNLLHQYVQIVLVTLTVC